MGLEASMLDLYLFLLAPFLPSLVVVVGDAQAIGLKMKMICVKNNAVVLEGGCWGLEVSTYFSRIADFFMRDTFYRWAIWKKGVALCLLWSLLSL